MERISANELSGGGIRFEFLSGECSVTSPGNYVIASGCGSGKTTAIVDLIKMKSTEGLLYSARTIEECDLMYEYLVVNGIDPSKIILLHSKSEDNGIYLHNSDYISNYDIVICTHHKLMNTPSELLLIQKKESETPPHMRYWADECGPSRMRKYVLIDEMIEKPGFTTRVPRHLIASLVMAIKQGIIGHTKFGYNYMDILTWYNDYTSLMGGYPTTFIDKYKIEYTLSLLSESLDQYISEMDEESSYVEVSYTLLDLLPGRKGIDVDPSRKPYFLIFDGTGDIFYKGSENLKILTTQDRYAGEVKLNTIPSRISRYENQDFSELRKGIFDICNDIKSIINKHKRTLIVTWKSIKGEVEINYEGVDFDANNFDYIELLDETLKSVGVSEDKYSIIHYQSGLDRAVNNFIDCDSVIFLGNHKIHSVALVNFNKFNKTKMSMMDYQAQMIVQAISRSQIRLHKESLGVSVTFTDDWSADLIQYIDYYMNQNLSVFEIYKKFKLSYWYQDIMPRWRDKLMILNDSFDDVIKKQILKSEEDREDIDIAIHKHKLVELIPSDGYIKRYDALLTYLKEFNIRLNVLVPRNRYIRISKDGKMIKFTILQEEIEAYIKDGYQIETKFDSYYK